MEYFIIFLAGMTTAFILQTFLAVGPTYKIFKNVEIYAVILMIEIESWRGHALTILRLCYEDAGKLDEYNKIEESVNKRYNETQQVIIKLIKEYVPYKIHYNTLNEAQPYVYKELKKLTGEEHEQE